MTNEFEGWMDGAPMICLGGDANFGVWLDGAPVVETDESGPLPVRRRVAID